MKRIKFFASILLMVLCFTGTCCAQTKIDWKQIKNIPDTLEFKNVLLEHLLFKSAYQPVMESIHQGAIYYDNMLERLRVYEHGQWRDLSVSIASDSIGAPLTILGYLQASDIYASQSAYIGKDVNVKGNVNASGTSTFNYLKVNNALKVPTVAGAALGVGSIYYNPTTKKLNILNSSNQWEPISIEVDSALSNTSTNPVQNKVITAKINQTDADLINGMAATLQASYNYSNGIATQAYNYADSTASASKNYADLQVNLLRSYVSQQLGSGTSDLYVHNIRVDNKLTVNGKSILDDDLLVHGNITASETIKAENVIASYVYASQELRLPSFSQIPPNNGIGHVQGSLGYNSTDQKLYYNSASGWKEVAPAGSSPSSSTPPSNPQAGQFYYNPTTNVMYYWNGTGWVPMSGGGSDVASRTASVDLGSNNFLIMDRLIYNNNFHPVYSVVDDTQCFAEVYKISNNHKILKLTAVVGTPSDFIHSGIIATTTYAIRIPDSVWSNQISSEFTGLTIESMSVYDKSYQQLFSSPGVFYEITTFSDTPQICFSFAPTWPIISESVIIFVVSYRYFSFY